MEVLSAHPALQPSADHNALHCIYVDSRFNWQPKKEEHGWILKTLP